MNILIPKTHAPFLSLTENRDLPQGLVRESGKLVYKSQSTTYQLCPFPLEEKRIEEVYELSKQAGFDDTLEDWKQHLRLARFAYAFIDTQTNKLVTTGMAVVFDNKVVRIIDILTESSHQNKGLAKTLFAYLLYLINQDPKLESIELEASANGSALYEKFSFQTDYKIVSYTRDPLSKDKEENGNCANNQYIIDDNDLNTIIKLDENVCGFSRANLIREVPRDQILVKRVGQAITGFLFYFEDSSGIRIGPWVQTNKEDIHEFLRECLLIINQRYPFKKLYIHVPYFCPEQDLNAVNSLKRLGFSKDDSIQTNHMYKGHKLQRNKSNYLAIWSTNWA